jgi:CRP/FNR family transcriptional regulator, cyclic AMP receptor protein
MSPLFSWIEVVGYLAAAATLLTFHSRTMIRLRWFAIAANVLFIGYGAAGGYYPVLFLHIVLLPLNIVRLRNMQHMTRQIERATLDEFNIDWLRPYMQSRGYKAGQFVFRKGDPAEEAFYVTSGELELTELGIVLRENALVGEMAIFTLNNARTQSLRCITDVEMLYISYDDFKQLYFQNPSFGLYLLRLIVQRMQANAKITPQPLPSPHITAPRLAAGE